MSASAYMVVAKGRIVSDFAEEQAQKNLRQGFKLTASQAEQFFSGKRIVVKRDLSHAKALLYRDKLLACGAECEVVPMPDSAGENKGQPDKPPASPAKAVSSSPATSDYPIYAPLYLTFFSGPFFRNIAHQWSVGRAFAYLALLVVLTQTPLVAYTQIKVNTLVTDYADVFPQIPEIHIKDGAITTEFSVPYIVQHDGEDFLIIDPEGEAKTLEESAARFLLHKTILFTKNKREKVSPRPIPDGFETVINQQVVSKWLSWSGWLWVALLPAFLLGNYLIFSLKALFYGGLGTLIAKRHLAKPAFDKVMILAIVCLTPVAMFDLVLAPFTGGTPFFIGMFFTVFLIGVVIRQHGRGERERAAMMSSPAGGATATDSPAPFETIEFHYGRNFNYLILCSVAIPIIPLLLLLRANGNEKLILLGAASLGIIFMFSLIITFITKRMPFATLDKTALALQQMTIPWSQLHNVQEKTINLGLFKWRNLVISGTFKAPLTGNKLTLPLHLIEKPDELVAAIKQCATIPESGAVRKQAGKICAVPGEEIHYQKMRFTADGIATPREHVVWQRVTSLTGQANVIAGFGTLTVGYLDNSNRSKSLTIPAETTRNYQNVVAYAISHAEEAEVDPELIKLLDKDVADARSSYLLLFLLLTSLVLLVAAVIVLDVYDFNPGLVTILIILQFLLMFFASKRVIFAGIQGEKVPLRSKKLWSWGAFSLPVAIVLLAMVAAPSARHWFMGNVTARLGSFEEAEHHYNQALELSHNNYLIRFDLGVLYMDRGDWPKSFDHLDTAVREHIDSWTPEAVLYVPEVLMNMGKREEAAAWCEQVLKDPATPKDVEKVLTNKMVEIRSGLT